MHNLYTFQGKSYLPQSKIIVYTYNACNANQCNHKPPVYIKELKHERMEQVII